MSVDLHHTNITARWRELAALASGIDPAKIVLEPTREDIMALIADLRLLVDKVDPLVEAYADYAAAYGGYSIDPEFRVQQLHGALDGNLYHEIEMAADEARERLLQCA